MSDYTPTTEDIRDVYMGWVPYSQQRGMEEFYRWLAAHDAEVRADEREKAAQRIDELLCWTCYSPHHAADCTVSKFKAVAAARGDGISDNPRPADSIGGEQA